MNNKKARTLSLGLNLTFDVSTTFFEAPGQLSKPITLLPQPPKELL